MSYDWILLRFILRFIIHRYSGRFMDTQWYSEVLPNVISDTGEGRTLPILFPKEYFREVGQCNIPTYATWYCQLYLNIYIHKLVNCYQEMDFLFQSVCLSIIEMRNFYSYYGPSIKRVICNGNWQEQNRIAE